MNCWHCNEELIWGGDHSYEDYGMDEDGIISNFSCSNEDCEVFVEVYLPIGEENEQDNIQQDTEVDKEVRKNA